MLKGGWGWGDGGWGDGAWGWGGVEGDGQSANREQRSILPVPSSATGLYPAR